MKITYGVFTAELDRFRVIATIKGTLDSGEAFDLCMFEPLISDRGLHAFDIESAGGWGGGKPWNCRPQMNAHERSDLCVLIRLVVMEAMRAQAADARGEDLDPDGPTRDL